MRKHLYFVCPTDNLENIIDGESKQENYYCTSLGNSIALDTDTLGQLGLLLESKNIEKMSFILASDNRIVSDALEKQNFLEVEGLRSFYSQILRQKNHAEVSWQTYDYRFLLLSYHLNNKIRELRKGLRNLTHLPLTIDGWIYDRRERRFSEIYFDSVCMESFALN